MATLQGRLTKIFWQGADNGFLIGALLDQLNEEHKVAGPIMAQVGDTITLTGEWVDHPKYGRQFKAKSTEIGQAKDRDGIVGYLERLPNIGPVRAALLHRLFRDQIFDVIENHPERLADAPGVTDRMVEEIRDAYMAEKAQRDLIVFLKKFDLTDNKISKIMTTYGPKLKTVLADEPYRMIQDIDGFGFKTVDAIALAAGMAKNAKARIQAGIAHALVEAQDEGHTYLPLGVLFQQAVKLLYLPGPDIQAQIRDMVETGLLVELKDGENQQCVALPSLFAAEQRTAGRIYVVAQAIDNTACEGGTLL